MSGGAFAGERAVVVGYGVSGRAAATVLLEEGAEVRVTEARPIEEIRAELRGRAEGPGEDRVELLAGGHRPEHLDGATLVVVSPGVPPTAPVVEWARRRDLPVISELELGARLCRVPYAAVTGTNGKTTTTEMVAAMLQSGGVAARACGNVGHPFSLAARDPSVRALVVEASSFQLAFHESLHPRVSALLNLSPDHLDWHGTFTAYAEAKARIYLRQDETDIHVGNRDEPEAAAVSREAPCQLRWFGWGRPGPGDVGVVEGRVVTPPPPIVAGAGTLLDLGRPRVPARSFVLDAAAAAAVALAFGVEPEAVREAVERFEPLPHRGSVVAEAAGVRFVDDSKATNPHAALAALEGLHDAVLIAGGLAKGVDLSPLRVAAPRLAGVVAIGEAAPVLDRLFAGLVPVRRAPSMEEAVEEAFVMAPKGGTVVLAPACASQDMFRDYRERGERFAAAARAVAARVAGEAP